MRSESDGNFANVAAGGRPRRAWFTDTLNDVNGVAMTIRKMAAAASENGEPITVVTSMEGETETAFPHVNLAPLAQFRLPRYASQKLAVPPVFQLLDFLRRGDFSEVVISTPGPVGLAALLAAKCLGLRTAGIYHTDFPQYVRILSGDSAMESLTWSFMRWFYGRMDIVWANSESYRRSWIERGIPESRLRILPRGLDTALFHPGKRAGDFWQKRGVAAGATVLLYVGRLSREKNLEVIADSWDRLRAPGVALAFVGDGPTLAEMKQRLPDAVFTGYLAGEELAAAYASADVFLFPSTTDTFGNVVIEAQACGLPCVVSDVGGPRDLVENGVTGFVTRALDVDDFSRAVSALIGNENFRKSAGEKARESVANRSWASAAMRFCDTLQKEKWSGR